MDAIRGRRSIRSYRSEEVPKEKIEEILRAGMLAPSSKNRQPWKMIVVSGAAKREMLLAMERGLDREESGEALLKMSREHLKGARYTLEIMRQAPVAILIVNRLSGDLRAPQNTEERIAEICNMQSIGAAVENMTLRATELGLGSLWICDIFFAHKELTEWLCAGGELVAALSVGYADEQPAPRPRRRFDEAAEWRSER